LPSRRSARALWWLFKKEWRELIASRSWWCFLLAMGPLVGVSFISAVNTYAEASGLHGTAAGVGEAFSPLIGIWAPTFGSCELAAAFLLPFVGIRLVSGDRQTGALKLEMQHSLSSFSRLAVKAIVLLSGWLIAFIAPIIAVLLWKIYGGSVYMPELLTIAGGHTLNAGLTIALAAATASIAEHPSTAAILTLSVTVGTWIINFIADVHGGIWERVAGYTPTAMVAEFQHGLVRVDVVLIALILIMTGLSLAAIWLRLGRPVQRRVYESIALGLGATVAILGCTWITRSFDTSENRMNSFPRPYEAALRQIHEPLRIVVHLAPEDPRRSDLDRQAISKLKRIMPNLTVEYVSATSIGLFEQTNEHYGEIWYELGGRKRVSRVTTAEGALESIYSLARITPPRENAEDVFRGHPLAVSPVGAAPIFYVVWPLETIVFGFFLKRRLA
jgi:ABC-type transport system involved in multi-copper enzyme maturation permease subunit